MRKLQSRWALLTYVAVLAACDGSPMGTDGGRVDAPTQADSGQDAGTDVCEGRDLCPTAGTSCDGDSLVTCAADADGCLVETRTECGADGDVCAGTPAACVDPCSLIPEEDRCDTDGARACEGNTLEICTMDAGGCLVLERTECDAMPEGFCNASGAMPICDLPPDPCEMIPAEERCTTAGTTCDGTSIVECAPNALGCLVTTRTDCSERASGTCDASSGAAQCVFMGDPCAGITQCATAGASCDGPVLVECDADAFGCLIETRTTCTDMTFGFCDADATPRAQCSTAATDPCMGVEQCGTEPSRSCADGTTLSVCAPNAFGCYVATPTDCATDGDVCSAASGMAMCVDPCSLVDTCPAATYCAVDDLVTCAPDPNGCLVETMRTTCADTCDAPGGTAACVTTACPQAQPGFLDCTSGTVAGNTSTMTGGTALNPGNYGSCYTGTNYAGNEQYWRFRNNAATRMDVQIVATRGTSTSDFDLFVMSAGDGTTTCTPGTGLSCLDSSRGVGATETVNFQVGPGELSYIVYDIWSSTTATTDYTLAITCTPIICGDGLIATGEQCDDGNTATGDGCSDTCTREAGYVCSGTPSVCAFACGNGTIDTAASETCDDGNTTASDGCSPTCTVETGYSCYGAGPGTCFVQAPNAACATPTALTAPGVFDEDLRAGGPRPTGTNCGSSPGPVRYYAVTLDPFTAVNVTAQPIFTSWDVTLRSLADCAGTCLSNVDVETAGGNETISLVNATASAVTQLVAVGADSATDFGRYNLTISAPTALPGNSSCATATPVTGATTIRGENARLGGPRPSGTGCGFGTGSTALYYAVTVPAGRRVLVQTTPATGSDIVLFTQLDCSATGCASQTNTAPEQTTLDNTAGAADLVRIVGVRPNTATSGGTYDIAFSYPVCGNGAVEAPEACDDANTAASDGCSATCTIEAGYDCTGTPSVCRIPYTRTTITAACLDVSAAPLISVTSTDDSAGPITALPFSFPFFGTTVSHYSVTTNGFAQLYTSETGTASTAFSNASIPATGAPNGFIAPYWDDLVINSGGGLRAADVGGTFVIEWSNMGLFSGTAALRFQAHILPSGTIELHYCELTGDVATGSSATIGIENLTGTAGSQQSFNTAGSAATGTAYRFTPNP